MGRLWSLVLVLVLVLVMLVLAGCGVLNPSSGGTDVDGGTPPSVDAGEDDAGSIVDTDLVLWWKLDENTGTAARDETENRNDGLFSASGVSWVPGKIDSALSFDGVLGQVSVKSSASLTSLTDVVSVAFWLQVLVNPTTNGELIVTDGWDIKMNGTRPQLTGNADGEIGRIEADVSATSWHHIVMIFDGGQFSGYLDGVSTTVTSQFAKKTLDPVGGDGISIGGPFPGSTASACKCLFDDVRLYHRVLSIDEARALALVQ